MYTSIQVNARQNSHAILLVQMEYCDLLLFFLSFFQLISSNKIKAKIAELMVNFKRLYSIF